MNVVDRAMPATLHQRHPHAVLDLPSRDWKAMKIECLLDLAQRPQPMRLLEVGTGSGGIAHYFAVHPTLRCDVTAVDICDNRLVRDGYKFRLVKGVDLPFDDGGFDVVITNHVIEHVGDAAAQHRHLSEIYRVMKPHGAGYLAVPNRWMLTEPHYKLKFLSWWPHAWRTPYLKLMRGGTFYDCEPLQVRQLGRMLAEVVLRCMSRRMKVWRNTREVERLRSKCTRPLRATQDVGSGCLKRVDLASIYVVERTPV